MSVFISVVVCASHPMFECLSRVSQYLVVLCAMCQQYVCCVFVYQCRVRSVRCKRVRLISSHLILSHLIFLMSSASSVLSHLCCLIYVVSYFSIIILIRLIHLRCHTTPPRSSGRWPGHHALGHRLLVLVLSGV